MPICIFFQVQGQRAFIENRAAEALAVLSIACAKRTRAAGAAGPRVSAESAARDRGRAGMHAHRAPETRAAAATTGIRKLRRAPAATSETSRPARAAITAKDTRATAATTAAATTAAAIAASGPIQIGRAHV